MVQVIGIGYGRTGTESLKEALVLLGFDKTFHTKTMMIKRPELLDLWYRNITSSTGHIDELFCSNLNLKEFLEEYTAASSMLLAICWKEALIAFPDAYFVLTQRQSSEEWFQSWSLLIDSLSLIPRYASWLTVISKRLYQIDAYNRWLLTYLHNGDDVDSSFRTTAQQYPQKQNAILVQQSYSQHLESVRQTIPAHQLLELELGSGWEPLCQFLNVSVPFGVDYPHVGTSSQLIWQCRCLVVIANLLLLLVLYGLTSTITQMIWNPTARTKTTSTSKASDKLGVPEEQSRNLEAANDDEEEEEQFLVPHVRILPEDNGINNGSIDDEKNPYLLTRLQMQQLVTKALPPMVALRCWKRLYRLSRDGDDFTTFLRATKGHSQTLIVIQPTTAHNKKQQLLGAFADSRWDIEERNTAVATGSIDHRGGFYYGSTHGCLYTFAEAGSKADGDRSNNIINDNKGAVSSPEDTLLKVYKWSGRNRYIQLLDIHNGLIAFGGGGASPNNRSRELGSFGLCLYDNFTKGTSSPCETFNNPMTLTGEEGEEQFTILDVEVWTFPHGTLG